MYPFVMFLIVPKEGSEIMKGIPQIVRDFEYNRVTQRFKAQGDVLEFIVMFEAEYQNFNIHKNGHR